MLGGPCLVPLGMLAPEVRSLLAGPLQTLRQVQALSGREIPDLHA